jgi:uncharacterized protein YgiM (DUF1202 family)
MKLNVWIVSALASLTAVMVMAQDTTPPSAVGANTPAPETAPAKPARKGSVKKRIVLNPPEAATVKSGNVNVRGQASFAGETMGHLQKGDTVTVLEQITLSHPKKDEPAEWAQIVMPASMSVWLSGDFIDPDTKTIKARRINLRGGPGENYSVVGRLEKGATVKEIKTEKGWVAIEPPTNAYAYVAAEFLEMQPAPAPVAVTPPPAAAAPEPQVVNVNTPAAPATVASEPVAPAPGAAPGTEVDRELEALHHAEGGPAPAPAPATTPEAAPTSPAAPATAPAPAASNEPAPPRIVTREGFVRRAYNIQSPTNYELRDIQSGKLIDYLNPKAGMNFKIFVGTRVTVTGPEGMDSRWPRTPVLDVQSVDLMP